MDEDGLRIYRQLVFMAGHKNSFQDYPGGGSENGSEIKRFFALQKRLKRVPAHFGWLFLRLAKDLPTETPRREGTRSGGRLLA